MCHSVILGLALLSVGLAGQASQENSGPRQNECRELAQLVSKGLGAQYTRSFGPRYFLMFPGFEGMSHSGVTIYCAGDMGKSSDEVELFLPRSNPADDRLATLAAAAVPFITGSPADPSLKQSIADKCFRVAGS
jgi:hypothetical protein